MSAFRFRAVALLMLVLHLGACTTWRPAAVAPRQLVEQEMPPSIRVRTLDGRQVVVRSPHIVRDTIFGVVKACRMSFQSQSGSVCELLETPLAPLADVQGVEVGRISAGRTVAAVLGLTVLIVGVLAATADYSVSLRSPS